MQTFIRHNSSHIKLMKYLPSTLRVLILILAFAAGTFMSMAEDIAIKPVEFEVRMGLTEPVGSFHNAKGQTGICLGIEGRYNIPETKFDCGMMLDLSAAVYDHFRSESPYLNQTNRSLALAFVGNYNLRQGTKVNPFAGLALGLCFHDVVGEDFYPHRGNSIFVAPRIGIEFLYHFRLMTQMNISRVGFNNAALTLAISFGGRPKK